FCMIWWEELPGHLVHALSSFGRKVFPFIGKRLAKFELSKVLTSFFPGSKSAEEGEHTTEPIAPITKEELKKKLAAQSPTSAEESEDSDDEDEDEEEDDEPPRAHAAPVIRQAGPAEAIPQRSRAPKPANAAPAEPIDWELPPVAPLE